MFKVDVSLLRSELGPLDVRTNINGRECRVAHD